MTDISQRNFQNRIEMRFPAIKSSASVRLNLQDFVTLRLQSALPRNKQFHLQGKAALPPPPPQYCGRCVGVVHSGGHGVTDVLRKYIHSWQTAEKYVGLEIDTQNHIGSVPKYYVLEPT